MLSAFAVNTYLNFSGYSQIALPKFLRTGVAVINKNAIHLEWIAGWQLSAESIMNFHPVGHPEFRPLLRQLLDKACGRAHVFFLERILGVGSDLQN